MECQFVQLFFSVSSNSARRLYQSSPTNSPSNRGRAAAAPRMGGAHREARVKLTLRHGFESLGSSSNLAPSRSSYLDGGGELLVPHRPDSALYSRDGERTGARPIRPARLLQPGRSGGDSLAA